MQPKPKRKPRGKPFGPDHKGGRPPGTPNKVTVEAKEFAKGILESDAYRAWLNERITEKALQPQIEVMLWAYAYGKPKETIEHQGNVGVTHAAAESFKGRIHRLPASEGAPRLVEQSESRGTGSGTV